MTLYRPVQTGSNISHNINAHILVDSVFGQTAVGDACFRVSGFPAGHAVVGEFFSSQRECVKQDSAAQV